MVGGGHCEDGLWLGASLDSSQDLGEGIAAAAGVWHVVGPQHGVGALVPGGGEGVVLGGGRVDKDIGGAVGVRGHGDGALVRAVVEDHVTAVVGLAVGSGPRQEQTTGGPGVPVGIVTEQSVQAPEDTRDPVAEVKRLFVGSLAVPVADWHFAEAECGQCSFCGEAAAVKGAHPLDFRRACLVCGCRSMEWGQPAMVAVPGWGEAWDVWMRHIVWAVNPGPAAPGGLYVWFHGTPVAVVEAALALWLRHNFAVRFPTLAS